VQSSSWSPSDCRKTCRQLKLTMQQNTTQHAPNGA
jgi:hypothetical protein